jgi:hypothetical protein
MGVVACGDSASSEAQDAGSGSTGPVCYDDSGMGLARAARSCSADSDCQVSIGHTCCGADDAYGVAKSQAQAYANCFGGGGNCGGLGCAKFIGFRVDTGETTDFQGGSDPMSQVAVHCKDAICTTSVIAADGGTD